MYFFWKMSMLVNHNRGLSSGYIVIGKILITFYNPVDDF